MERQDTSQGIVDKKGRVLQIGEELPINTDSDPHLDDAMIENLKRGTTINKKDVKLTDEKTDIPSLTEKAHEGLPLFGGSHETEDTWKRVRQETGLRHEPQDLSTTSSPRVAGTSPPSRK